MCNKEEKILEKYRAFQIGLTVAEKPEDKAKVAAPGD